MMSIKTPLYTPDDLPIMDLDQIYMTSSAWYATGFRDTWATFDLLVRDMPPHRNFLVFTGLEEIIRGIMRWRYSAENVRVLRKHKLISGDFARYLARFRFTGTVYAMSEGTLFFPGEPIVRITAPIIEANLFTAFLITAVTSNTIVASKFIRSVIAAKDRNVIGVAPQRATSFEQAFKAERSAFIAGSNQVPSPIVREKCGIPLGDNATIAYHAFITSYPTERAAMDVAAEHAQIDLSLMIDTYDVQQGLRNAIDIARALHGKGKRLKIVIDSGNLLSLSRFVRNALDREGLQWVRIVVASNLEEYKIARLVRAGIPANTFIVNTEAITSSDSPKLEAVYKLAEIIHGKRAEPKMKLSYGKVSLPGRKQVFRVMRRGIYERDVIGLDRERLGEPLLAPMIVQGKQVYHLPKVTQIRSYVGSQLTHLPPRLKEVLREHRYLVTLSPKLRRLIQIIRKNHLAQYDI